MYRKLLPCLKILYSPYAPGAQSKRLRYKYFFSNLEQQAIVGRAKIEKNRLEQLAEIEAKRKEALANLNIKYALADKVKTSFGYIGIISLCLLWTMFILNDLGKLLVLCYEETKDLLKERRQLKDKKQNEIGQVKIELEQEEDGEYLQNLQEKLDQVNLLIKACAARRHLKK